MTSEGPERDPAARAADIAARQVEEIVAAAQEAAERIAAEGRRELSELRRQALKEADELRAAGKRAADTELETARARAIQLGEDARREADLRLSEAQRAADQALTEARALSRGLRQLGTTLTEHAERILRDVQAGHRAITADLRAAGGDGALPRAEPVRRRARDEAEPAGRPRGGSPFDDLDVPSWVER